MVSLPEVTQYLTIYGFFIILFFGTIGNSLNLFTLATKDFRKTASVFYLICSAISSQVLITVGIIFRYTTEYIGNNLINTDRNICKARNYLLICIPLTSTMFLFLASFDRCVSTSSNTRWRELSSISLARRNCFIAMVFSIVSTSFFIFVYDIYNGRCTASPGIGSIMVNVYITVVMSSIPICGMCICGILTWIHLKQSRNRTETVTVPTGQNSNSQRMSRQLIILVFVQASLSAIMSIVRTTVFVYTIATALVQKSVERQQIDYFIQQVSVMLLYINHSVPFYLNYTFSSAFRKSFHVSTQHLINKCVGFCKSG